MNRMIEETEEGDDNYSFRNNDEDKYDDDQCNHGGCDDRDYDATIVPGGDATVIDGFVVVVIPLAAAIVVVVVAVIVVRVFVGGGGGGGGGNGAGRGDLDQYMQGEVVHVTLCCSIRSLFYNLSLFPYIRFFFVVFISLPLSLTRWRMYSSYTSSHVFYLWDSLQSFVNNRLLHMRDCHDCNRDQLSK